jgi:uncharacterized oxidoreductase
MKLTNNTILITGGSSGIGLEMSRQLTQLNNQVIICGRSKQRLEEAKAQIPELDIYPCDLSNKGECEALATWVTGKYPMLNVLINNAAIVHKTQFLQEDTIVDMAEKEMQTNFLAPVRLVHLLYPHLRLKNPAAIIHITTGLIYSPRADYPFYNATKAALHSFTQVFRRQTAHEQVEVMEVMFPAVDTPWHKGNPPKIAIPPQKAVREMLSGWQKGKTEIRVGGAKLLYNISRIAPGFAFKKVNNLVER